MTLPAHGSERFDLWAPEAQAVTLLADGRKYPMNRGGAARDGWWTAAGAPAAGDVDYGYLVDGDTTRCRTRGPGGSPTASTRCRGPSTPAAHAWADGQWAGRGLQGAVIYELHMGTFTPEGTLDAAAGKLDYLVGSRRRLRRAAAGQRLQRHPQLGLRRGALVRRARGLRRARRVPALRRRRATPPGWASSRTSSTTTSARAGTTCRGSARTSSGGGQHLGRLGQPGRPGLRRGAPLHPGQRRHVAARLPRGRAAARRRARLQGRAAPCTCWRSSARSRTRSSAETGRPATLIAESDLNDPRLLYPRDANGYGLAGQWSDDFHHAVHVNVSGETTGYYADFESLEALAKVLTRRVLPRRQLLQLPRAAPRPADRHRAGPPGRAGGVQPEPRPDRQPGHRRPAVPDRWATGSWRSPPSRP